MNFNIFFYLRSQKTESVNQNLLRAERKELSITNPIANKIILQEIRGNEDILRLSKTKNILLLPDLPLRKVFHHKQYNLEKIVGY